MITLNKTGKNPNPFLKVGSEKKANTLEYMSKAYIKQELYDWLKALTVASKHKTVRLVFNILIEGVRLYHPSRQMASFYRGPREEPTRWNSKCVPYTNVNYKFLHSHFSYGKSTAVESILHWLRTEVLTASVLQGRHKPRTYDAITTHYMWELFGIPPVSLTGGRVF